jgi:hypothetical protein
MESRTKKTDPLDVLPDVLLNSIAYTVGNISIAGVEGSAKRLGIQITRTATGRQAVPPRDALRIIAELRARLAARNAV